MNVLEELEWLKGNYTRLTSQFTRIEITEQEQEAFNQIEKALKKLVEISKLVIQYLNSISYPDENFMNRVLKIIEDNAGDDK